MPVYKVKDDGYAGCLYTPKRPQVVHVQHPGRKGGNDPKSPRGTRKYLVSPLTQLIDVSAKARVEPQLYARPFGGIVGSLGAGGDA